MCNPNIHQFLDYMFESGVLPRTREISEENNLVSLLKDCATSGLMMGLDDLKDFNLNDVVIPVIEVHWDEFLDERFN